MITRRTKVQLLVFVLITVIGVTYVGARYAQLDRFLRDTSYDVTAHFSQSGGIFAGAEVTYRGVTVGRVDKMELTPNGVDVVLQVENAYDDIPADTLAVVGNKSAIGEQYVDLQPKTDSGPYLDDDAEIPSIDTRTPIQTDKLLTDISDTVSSVDKQALKTTVDELGAAFGGTGRDLQRILDTGSSFIETADDNFDVTTRLIEDSNTVLTTQVDSESSLRTFASQLSLFSTTLAQSDGDLRRVIDVGSPAVNQLRGFIEDNKAEFQDLLNNLITTGEVVTKRLPGLEQILVIYPYVVEGAATVLARDPGTDSEGKSNLFSAHFGLIIGDTMPCEAGYQGTDERLPNDRNDLPMNVDARCTEPPTQSNARGAQNLTPRPAADYDPDSVIATYDTSTGRVELGDDTRSEELSSAGTVAPASLGKEDWKWLYLQPMMGSGS